MKKHPFWWFYFGGFVMLFMSWYRILAGHWRCDGCNEYHSRRTIKYYKIFVPSKIYCSKHVDDDEGKWLEV